MNEGLAANFKAVQARIEAAQKRRAGAQKPVRLIAVSKLQPDIVIRAAHAATGHVDFGENYAQELRDKARDLADVTDLVWHAIGPLQRKNAKYVANTATYFHALDSVDVAQELARRLRDKALKCLIEVNLAYETTKGGVAPSQAAALLDEVRKFPQLEVIGLTAMPPLADKAESSRPYFQTLARLAAELGLAELSMGTSADFEVAIEEGATMVRVGTALLGERK